MRRSYTTGNYLNGDLSYKKKTKNSLARLYEKLCEKKLCEKEGLVLLAPAVIIASLISLIGDVGDARQKVREMEAGLA